jgi:hypothetical protein
MALSEGDDLTAFALRWGKHHQAGPAEQQALVQRTTQLLTWWRGMRRWLPAEEAHAPSAVPDALYRQTEDLVKTGPSLVLLLSGFDVRSREGFVLPGEPLQDAFGRALLALGQQGVGWIAFHRVPDPEALRSCMQRLLEPLRHPLERHAQRLRSDSFDWLQPGPPRTLDLARCVAWQTGPWHPSPAAAWVRSVRRMLREDDLRMAPPVGVPGPDVTPAPGRDILRMHRLLEDRRLPGEWVAPSPHALFGWRTASAHTDSVRAIAESVAHIARQTPPG